MASKVPEASDRLLEESKWLRSELSYLLHDSEDLLSALKLSRTHAEQLSRAVHQIYDEMRLSLERSIQTRGEMRRRSAYSRELCSQAEYLCDSARRLVRKEETTPDSRC